MCPDSSAAATPVRADPTAAGDDREAGPGSGGGFGTLVFALGLAVLAFVGGAVVVLADVPPARILKNAYAAALALYDQQTRYDDVFQTDLWRPARTDRRGTTIHDASRAYNGLTLYTSGDSARAALVTMDGRVVHQWSLPFSKVWDENAAVQHPRPDSHVHIHKAHLYPNGDLLAVYEGSGDSPYGYGLVKMNKDSEVVWKYMANAHHDVAVGDDGRIYVLTQEVRQNADPAYPHLTEARLDDFLVVLSPEGEELRKISLLDAFARSPWGRLLGVLPPGAYGDPLHANAVDWIGPETAEHFPFASPGQVVLSMRAPGAIGVLDLESEGFVWATHGPWLGQHDPELLANGHILLFDNLGSFGPGGTSRVIELDPNSMQIVWSYTGSEEEPLQSGLRSTQQRLPNGNTLITESDGGRLLEVTAEGDIVWEYVNPVRGGEGDAFIPVLNWGRRFAEGDLDPEFFETLSVNRSER